MKYAAAQRAGCDWVLMSWQKSTIYDDKVSRIRCAPDCRSLVVSPAACLPMEPGHQWPDVRIPAILFGLAVEHARRNAPTDRDSAKILKSIGKAGLFIDHEVPYIVVDSTSQPMVPVILTTAGAREVPRFAMVGCARRPSH